MSAPTLEEMEARAMRQLDGMKVNHDVMAGDVLRLISAIRGARKRAVELDRAKEKPSNPFDQFENLFGGGLFGGGGGRK